MRVPRHDEHRSAHAVARLDRAGEAAFAGDRLLLPLVVVVALRVRAPSLAVPAAEDEQVAALLVARHHNSSGCHDPPQHAVHQLGAQVLRQPGRQPVLRENVLEQGERRTVLLALLQHPPPLRQLLDAAARLGPLVVEEHDGRPEPHHPALGERGRSADRREFALGLGLPHSGHSDARRHDRVDLLGHVEGADGAPAAAPVAGPVLLVVVSDLRRARGRLLCLPVQLDHFQRVLRRLPQLRVVGGAQRDHLRDAAEALHQGAQLIVDDAGLLRLRLALRHGRCSSRSGAGTAAPAAPTLLGKAPTRSGFTGRLMRCEARCR